MADSYKIDDGANQQPQEASFFNGKLRLVAKDCFDLNAEDVLVVPCSPDILSRIVLLSNIFNIRVF
jgi:hypothetical protein